MNTQDYTTTIHASTSPKKAVLAIDHVGAWWTGSFRGAARRVGDTFTVRFGDTFVAFEVVEHTDERIVWRVTDSLLPWLRDKTEWTGTDVIWGVAVEGRGASVQMTHRGLVPTAECYANCERGWDFYVGKSLRRLLVEGEGLPDGRTREHAVEAGGQVLADRSTRSKRLP
jgi:hypothetical protein